MLEKISHELVKKLFSKPIDKDKYLPLIKMLYKLSSYKKRGVSVEDISSEDSIEEIITALLIIETIKSLEKGDIPRNLYYKLMSIIGQFHYLECDEEYFI